MTNLFNFIRAMASLNKEVDEFDRLFSEKKFQDALGYINDAISSGKNYPPISSLLACKGDALKALGREAEAEKVYHDALFHSAADYRATVGLAGLYIDQGRKTEAVPLLQACLKSPANTGYVKPLEELLEKASQ